VKGSPCSFRPIRSGWSASAAFSLACLAGAILPALWALIFSGYLPAPSAPFTSIQWHAHEMFFGFGWAVLGGFLLTSTKNWVNIRGYHGPALMLLAGAWIVERFAMSFGGTGRGPVPAHPTTSSSAASSPC
jgi:uncharacterized protein involved in response to NO